MTLRLLKIFVLSPGDLKDERDFLKDLGDKLNLDRGFREHFKIIVQMYKNDVPPLIGENAQATVNDFMQSKDVGYQGAPFVWDEERRFLMRRELDALYFHLYQIQRDDVDDIMDTFPIVRRKDEAKHGEFLTKRVILEMYDHMAELAPMPVPAPKQPGGAEGLITYDVPDVSVAHGG